MKLLLIFPLLMLLPCFCFECSHAAISHAMARDGSSGGVIRLVVIDQTGIEKEVVLGKRSHSSCFSSSFFFFFFFFLFFFFFFFFFFGGGGGFE